jgi:uncharacterized protein
MSFTAFRGATRITTGNILEVAFYLKDHPGGEVLVFDDSTGRQIDLDVRGTPEELSGRYSTGPPAEPRGRGRPRLGVVAKEVTLLPRHWDWLSTQPGGASVALRKLVDQARRSTGDGDRARAAQEAAYRFVSAMASDLPGFEDASRALFAYDLRRFAELIAAWPQDIRDYAIQLAFSDRTPAP